MGLGLRHRLPAARCLSPPAPRPEDVDLRMLSQMSETHGERIERVRAAYREAHGRFVKRLTDAPADAVERAPAGGGWSAAQIGWHVAAVDASFAGLVSGENPAAKPLPDGTTEKPWTEIVQGIPEKLEAGERGQPPPGGRRDRAPGARAASAGKHRGGV